MAYARATKASTSARGRPTGRLVGAPRPRAPSAAPAPPIPSHSDLVHLQATAGNGAVTGMLEGPGGYGLPPAVQRSEISYADAGETLYSESTFDDSSVAPGTFGPAFYSSGTIKYEMTRGPGGVTVAVRVKFVNQARDTRRRLPNGRENPNFEQPRGPITSIPAGDERIDFATRMCGLVTSRWNGKLVFTSKEQPAPGAVDADGSVPKPKEVRLPVKFRAVPVFNKDDANVHSTVQLFGSGVEAGSAGHPIDAGNYYMNLGSYVSPDATAAEIEDEQVATYAHEYGHFLGLDDEYSRSNHQAHQMLHRVSPTLGGDRGAALDRATVERMVLAALTPPLTTRLRAVGPRMASSLASLKPPLQVGLTDAIAASVSNPILNAVMSALLVPRTSARLRGRIGKVVDFSLGRSLSARDIARRLVRQSLSSAALTSSLVDQFWMGMMAIHGEKTDVGGGASGQFLIEIAGADDESGIWSAAARGPLKAQAGAEADQLIGPAPARRIPRVAPSTSIVGQIEGIPTALEAAAAATGSMVSEGAVLRRMLEAVVSETMADESRISSMKKLNRVGYRVAQNAAVAAARTVLVELLSEQLDPIISSSVETLRASVAEEVKTIMSTPAGVVAAAAPKDPEIAAIASAMKDRLAAQTPAGRTSENPMAGGQPATEPAAGSQEIRYDTTGIMSDNSEDIRPDQFTRMVTEFNLPARVPELRRPLEDPFSAERI